MIDTIYDSYWLLCIAIEQAVFQAIGIYPPIWLIWHSIPISLGLLACVLTACFNRTSKQSSQEQ